MPLASSSARETTPGPETPTLMTASGLFGRRATLLMTPTDAGLNERVDIAVEHGLGLRSLIAGAQILDLLRRINRELNVTLVIITHSLSVARNICDRVISRSCQRATFS